MSYSCSHLKEDGVPCGSPSLRGKKLCFFHLRDYKRRQYLERLVRQNDPLRPAAPLPTTLLDMQMRLHEVVTALIDDRISDRRAGKLLYALQQRSVSLRNETI